MKHFVDQKGKIVKFGDMIHYHESTKENGYSAYYDIHVTLIPGNVEHLKAIGAIKEVEEEPKNINLYEEKLKDILCPGNDKFINRFKTTFPAQYLSAIITLIHDDIDSEENLKDYGFIFNMSTGKMESVKIDPKNPLTYINVFSSDKTRMMCMDIIAPWVKMMYK